MGRFKWEKYGTEAIGSNPPLPIYRAEIGTDENGYKWLCEVKFRTPERKWMVRFDKDVLTNDGCPFLRGRVVDADDYWWAMRTYHMMTLCNYEDIQCRIDKVIAENNLH